MKMKKSLLSAIVGFTTLALMQGADTQTQPAAGSAAPDFSLKTSDGSEVGLKNFKGKWVVLYFYPKDMTSGCTMAAKNTFLINPEGKIAKVYTGVKPAEHSDEVLKDLAELKKS